MLKKNNVDVDVLYSLAATRLLWQTMRRGRIALETLKCTLTEATMDSRQEYSYFIHLVECHYMYSNNVQSRYAAAISITFAATLQAELDATMTSSPNWTSG